MLGVDKRVQREGFLDSDWIGTGLECDEDRQALHRMSETLFDGEGDDVQYRPHDGRWAERVGGGIEYVLLISLYDSGADSDHRKRRQAAFYPSFRIQLTLNLRNFRSFR